MLNTLVQIQSRVDQ